MTLSFAVREGILRARRPGTRWLATGPNGGYARAPAAYNVTVPEGFARTDLVAYARERRRAAGFSGTGPTMLTGVSQQHARGAHTGPVQCVATAGLSNPAAFEDDEDGSLSSRLGVPSEDSWRPGTVNLVVATTRALGEGALATLLATAVEAKTATLGAAVGFTGTTSDAVVVGADPRGDRANFAGSATEVGAATRVCVRAAIEASLASRYADEPVPSSVEAADHGVRTAGDPEVFAPD